MRQNWILLLALVAPALPLLAHHGFQAEYDGSKIVYITGTLTKVDWSNPHVHFYVDAKDADGKVTAWNFEGSATTLVERNGTHRADLLGLIGKEVTVRACPGRNIITRGAAEIIKTPDGQELIVGGSRYRGEDTKN